MLHCRVTVNPYPYSGVRSPIPSSSFEEEARLKSLILLPLIIALAFGSDLHACVQIRARPSGDATVLGRCPQDDWYGTCL